MNYHIATTMLSPPPIRLSALVWLILFVCPCAQAQQADAPDSDIAVSVQRDGDLRTIDTAFYVDVRPELAWEVITDYDHAAQFISDLDYSKVEKRDGNVWDVRQKGTIRFGPFSLSLESVRRIELFPPDRTESRLLSGSAKRLEGTTLVKAEGEGTRIINHTEVIPNFWIPSFVENLLFEHESRKKLGELRREMLKRSRARLPPSSEKTDAKQ